MRQQIAAVLDYAHRKGWRGTEAPMRAVNQLLGGIKQPRGGDFAAMPYRELPTFLQKLPDFGLLDLAARNQLDLF